VEQVLGLKCTICGRVYSPQQAAYVCPEHGVDGTLDVQYDYDWVAAHLMDAQWAELRSMWRYMALLPVEPEAACGLFTGNVLSSVGWTPLYPAERLAQQLGLRHVWIKDDGRQPTASLKDRASAIAIAKAGEGGYTTITTASTGNAAAALAGLCAAVAQPCVIFCPATAPEAKVTQLLVYGARVLLVDGTYDEAFELCLAAAPEFGWYNRNTGYNPYMSEGKKTAALEICEQLGNGQVWRAPDVVLVPVGDGCIIGGVHKGFSDLHALGLIDRVPRLIGVQAAGAAPLVDAWERGIDATEMASVPVDTVADSIAAGLPRDRVKAMRAVRESGGAFLSVTDEEILDAIPALARASGVFAEPAAAAAYAGLLRAVEKGAVDREDRVVVLVTGSGLKDVPAARRAVTEPPVIRPRLGDVRRALQAG
jgi:threonine synthase